MSTLEPLVVMIRVSPRLRRTNDGGLPRDAADRLRERISEIERSRAVGSVRSQQAMIR